MDIEDSLKQLAQRIVDLRLESLSVFLLEAHRPMTTILQTGALILEPVAAPILGRERIQNVQALLAERSNIDRLIELIEELSDNHTCVRDGTR